MVRFRYAPFRPDMAPASLIVVGAAVPARLHLSPWPGNATPPPLKGDTSLESALKFLNRKSPQREAYRQRAEAVTSPAFGVDPLLALWALSAPHRAQGFTGPLQAAAFSDAYEVPVFPEATKIACALQHLGDPDRSSLRAEFAGGDGWARLGSIYAALLPRLDEVFGSVERFETAWGEAYEQIRADRRLLAEGGAVVEEFPEVDLAVIRGRRRLHPVARNGATDRLRVLTISGEHMYELIYRAETWVDLAGRSVAPRIDLAPLLPELQGLESAGTWHWDGLARPVPALRCADETGRSSASGIAPDRFIPILRRYLAAHAEDLALRWNPRAPHPELLPGDLGPGLPAPGPHQPPP